MKTTTFLDRYTNVHGKMSIRMNSTNNGNMNRYNISVWQHRNIIPWIISLQMPGNSCS